jgi:hypothetical protein
MRLAAVIAPSLLFCLSSCVEPAPGHGPRAEAGYHAAAPIIDALDRFHRDHGRYPAKLAELSPKYVRDAASLQLFHSAERLHSNVREGFDYIREGDSYTLSFTYTGPGINRCWYDSKSKKWESKGYY